MQKTHEPVTDRGYTTLDHTADLALMVWAPGEAEVLLEAGRAIIDVLTESAELTGTETRTLEIDALDPEDRLVRWLNEVLVLAIVEGYLFTGGELTLREGGLRARVIGQPNGAEHIRTELKSVTYHDLFVGPEGEGWTARVVVDV